MSRNRSRNREMSDVLYYLKHQLGIDAQLYRISTDSVNRATGEKTISRTTIKIKRMIVFPVRSIMKFQQTISYLAANKNFTYGGEFKIGDRELIIDQRDLPTRNYELSMSDYIVFDGKRYNIVDTIALDFRKGWYIHGRQTQEQKTYQLIDGLFVERPILVESLSYTVN